jgi:ElaB/YqjD/DUF883 family membrane-anchored ribosome-binding protein
MLKDPTHFSDGIAHEALSQVHAAADQAKALMQQSMDALEQGSERLQHFGQHAQDVSANYIRRDPIKSVLVAAATGALMMGLISLMTRRS